ncbi:MAG: hypothetical protein JNM90_12705 [Burkholderiales bacterium]|nr:hypothetical protein [Burkholderiales bacterium]
MRRAVVLVVVAGLAGCAAGGPGEPAAPAQVRAAEDPKQACADRLYTARLLGGAHWHIYENCLKEHS